MAISRSSHDARPHPLFRAVFADWRARSGALSALPDAPVVRHEQQRHSPLGLWIAARLAAGRAVVNRPGPDRHPRRRNQVPHRVLRDFTD